MSKVVIAVSRQYSLSNSVLFLRLKLEIFVLLMSNSVSFLLTERSRLLISLMLQFRSFNSVFADTLRLVSPALQAYKPSSFVQFPTLMVPTLHSVKFRYSSFVFLVTSSEIILLYEQSRKIRFVLAATFNIARELS